MIDGEIEIIILKFIDEKIAVKRTSRIRL